MRYRTVSRPNYCSLLCAFGLLAEWHNDPTMTSDDIRERLAESYSDRKKADQARVRLGRVLIKPVMSDFRLYRWANRPAQLVDS